MMQRRTLMTLSLAQCVLFAGCSVFREQPSFSREGRFSLTVSNAQGQKTALSGRFAVRRFRNTTTLDLMTPLNGVLAHVKVSARGAELTRYDSDEVMTGTSAEELTEKTLGMRIPVEAVEAWLTTNKDNLYEHHWQIRVLRRTPDGSPQTLRAAYPARQITLTLAIDPH